LIASSYDETSRPQRNENFGNRYNEGTRADRPTHIAAWLETVASYQSGLPVRYSRPIGQRPITWRIMASSPMW